MPHAVIFYSDAFQEYAHVANEMPVFELLEYIICCEIMILRFQVTQDPFGFILCKVLQN